MKKKVRMVQSLVLIVFIVLFAFITLVTPKSDFSEAENRALQTRPELSLDAVKSGDFQTNYENYLSDQFFGRELFVNLKTRGSRLLGKKDINGVYVGKDDYLIEKHSYGDYDEDRVNSNIEALADFMNRMTAKYGKEHTCLMFVPAKDAAMSNKLPAFAKPLDTSLITEKMSKLLDDGGAGADVMLDLTETMKSHEDEYIYFRTDHHWTMRGAYYGYCDYAMKMGLTLHPSSDYDITEVAKDFYGTTFDKIQLKKTPDIVELLTLSTGAPKVKVKFDDDNNIWQTLYKEDAVNAKDKYTYFLGGNTAKIQVNSNTKNNKTLLLVKDSFSNCLIPFLTSEYERIYMIDLRYSKDMMSVTMDKINSKHTITDVLVCFNYEKFMEATGVTLLKEADALQ
ncbi:MAG: hypothetical protein IKQ71_08195 [Lachnospiraceae bacterium]|nr:hypothetical protein [Lachnospiraceae bacterium]